MIKKTFAKSLKKLSVLTSVGIRLVKLTGKSKEAIHPKHLIKHQTPWYSGYINNVDEILDIGCGIGQESIKCAKLARSVTGFDINSNNTAIAKNLAMENNLKNVKFFVHNAEDILPFTNKTFNKILIFDVLEHLKNREKLIKEVKRVLKNNGKIFLLTDNPETSWKRFQKSAGLFYYADADHKYEYPKTEIIMFLKNNGFRILSIKPDTYDTPLKPFIDLAGGLSLSLYSLLSNWRREMVVRHPRETTGFRIIAQGL